MSTLTGRTLRGAFVTALLAAGASAGGAQPLTTDRWPVKSREHVDLWLHGFAMLSSDTSRVPLFRRDYRDSLTAARSRANVTSDFDANREEMARRLRDNSALVNAQFLALYFGSWNELSNAIDYFLKAQGDPRASRSREAANEIAMIASVFPTKADREFARLLLVSLRSERERFFHSWWLSETRHRDRAMTRVDEMWQREVRPKLQRFLDHTQQGNGELVLSPALEGEGRTVSGGKTRGMVAVGFPLTPEAAPEAIYAAIHEMVGPLAETAIADNTTPAEKRSGAAARLQSAMLVRAGALLAKRVSPELGDGYARFYARITGAGDGDPWSALQRAFPVPAALLDSIDRQIAVAFGGI